MLLSRVPPSSCVAQSSSSAHLFLLALPPPPPPLPSTTTTVLCASQQGKKEEEEEKYVVGGKREEPNRPGLLLLLLFPLILFLPEHTGYKDRSSERERHNVTVRRSGPRFPPPPPAMTTSTYNVVRVTSCSRGSGRRWLVRPQASTLDVPRKGGREGGREKKL